MIESNYHLLQYFKSLGFESHIDSNDELEIYYKNNLIKTLYKQPLTLTFILKEYGKILIRAAKN